MNIAALPFRYDGDGIFTAAGKHFARRADAAYVVGEVYPMAVEEGRSGASHRHEFAWLRDAWLSLPERHQGQPWAQSAEGLRKFALIQTRFCDTQTFACASKAEAERWATNLRPIDEYSIVTIEGTTVFRFTAQSQSVRAMGPKRFQQSKQAILEYIAGLLEVTPAELQKAEAA